jgi:hypothetical protein
MKSIYILLALAIAGCVSPQQRTENIIGKGQPPAYRDGFTHGCGSGEKAAGDTLGRYQKSVDLYMTDELYRTGWDDGYRHCMEEHKAFLRLIR